eukprot:m.58604 g.58604  ORF g.58604 m.58604 type:complete len:194 (-) comp7871_c2_seq1:1129-1710(-)
MPPRRRWRQHTNAQHAQNNRRHHNIQHHPHHWRKGNEEERGGLAENPANRFSKSPSVFSSSLPTSNENSIDVHESDKEMTLCMITDPNSLPIYKLQEVLDRRGISASGVHLTGDGLSSEGGEGVMQELEDVEDQPSKEHLVHLFQKYITPKPKREDRRRRKPRNPVKKPICNPRDQLHHFHQQPHQQQFILLL